MTTPVRRFVSFFVGQLTFFISRMTSLKNPFKPLRDFGIGRLPPPPSPPLVPVVPVAIYVLARTHLRGMHDITSNAARGQMTAFLKWGEISLFLPQLCQ